VRRGRSEATFDRPHHAWRYFQGLTGALDNNLPRGSLARSLHGRSKTSGGDNWEPNFMRDDHELEPDHPLSENVSPPVFAIVALLIVGVSLAAFAHIAREPPGAPEAYRADADH
jgi:hypothetical protein